MKRNTTLKAAIKRLVKYARDSGEAEFVLWGNYFQFLQEQTRDDEITPFNSDFPDYSEGIRIAFSASYNEMELALLDAIRELVVERQREDQGND